VEVEGCFGIIGEAIKAGAGAAAGDMIAAEVVGDLSELAAAHKKVFAESALSRRRQHSAARWFATR
jgi:hypothetical protein